MFDTVTDTATRLDLRNCVQRLTQPQSLALRLWLVGYTHAEIGQRMGVTRRAISYRIERAKARLAGFPQ